MKLFYNAKLNIAYLALRDKPEAVESLPINKHIVLDLGPDGTLYGIELLNASQQFLQHDGMAFLQLINQVTGSKRIVGIEW